MERKLVIEENYSIFRGLTRLTYSVFMSNYLFIRTGFFSRTVLYPIENLPFVSSIFFHLFLNHAYQQLQSIENNSK